MITNATATSAPITMPAIAPPDKLLSPLLTLRGTKGTNVQHWADSPPDTMLAMHERVSSSAPPARKHFAACDGPQIYSSQYDGVLWVWVWEWEGA